MIRLQWHLETVSTTSTGEPEWASLVERWYQLDSPAFVLTETYWRLRERCGPNPDWLILASPGASNSTDIQFARTTNPSPAKFVHTLPNIRSAALLQVMNWSGRVLCLQNDPWTLAGALREAADLHIARRERVWIASVVRHEGAWTGHLMTLGVDDRLSPYMLEKKVPEVSASTGWHDMDLVRWRLQRAVEHVRADLGAYTLSEDQ